MMLRGLGIAALLGLAAPAHAADKGCNRECLNDHAKTYVAALVAKDISALSLSEDVRFSENLVPLEIGKEGLWRTISGKRDWDVFASDEYLGNANWIGIVEEMGKAIE